MFIDARFLASGTLITADLCIMGAGAAGITMAVELAASGLNVCVLESGGFEFEDATQQLYRGHISRQPYPELDVSRLRMFGGSTNHWDGSCGPLDPLDFAPRSWVQNSGWPFGRNDLDAFYARAQGYCELGPYRYDVDYWHDKAHFILYPTNPDRIVTKVLQVSPPTRFGSTYRSIIAQATNIKVYLHANVVELETTLTNDTVKIVHAAVLDGPEFSIRAKNFVLALGGIENARMLLVSNRHNPNGVGNGNGLVGRFFMDHPSAEGAMLLPTSQMKMPMANTGHNERPKAVSFLQLGTTTLRENSLLNVKFSLIPASRYHLSDGIASYHAFRRALEHGDLPDDLWDHVGNIATDLDMIGEAASRKALDAKLFDSADDIVGYIIHAVMEQTPDPNNRVTLFDERDAFGLRKANVFWRLDEPDRENLWSAYRILAGELGRLGVGRVRIKTGDRAQRVFSEQLGFGDHHMGTTRAHARVQKGVVDHNLKVHEVSNLFVVGSSVFPTGGHVPPTLTIVALAIRLSDHLKQIMA